MAILMPE